MCAIHGALPSQPDRSMRFANAPRQCEVEPLGGARSVVGGGGDGTSCAEASTTAPAPMVAGAKARRGYALPDIFHLEVCVLHHVCTNGDQLFGLNAGEPFVCQFSEPRFEALAYVLSTSGCNV